jgi:hypothetical protein
LSFWRPDVIIPARCRPDNRLVKKNEPAMDPPARKCMGHHPVFTDVRRHLVQSTLVTLRFPCQMATF